ncbi:MAG: HdeD family acid-resistance protein [Pirellulales bacterium]|nr:HdeD family acid-resistance protein [Pirellulales bacterium]
MNHAESGLNLSRIGEEYNRLRGSWGWFMALGVALVILGSVAIGWACLREVTIAATWLFGWVMIAAGVAEVVHAFSVTRWSGTLLHLLMGVMYGVVGILTIEKPELSAIIFTQFLAIFFIVSGAFRILAALVNQFPGWGWVLVNGVVTLVLGVMIYKEWPYSGLWFIGLYLGIDMILNGWTWIFLALGLKRLPSLGGAKLGTA